ncbi:MAG: Calx-beta domain-containing protein [Cyanobacteria bacterium P01_H01_bin.15]
MNDDLTPILGTEADEEILLDLDLINPPTGLEVSGLGGNDTIDGTPGDGSNVLKGGPGNDELFPNTNDQLFGEEDDDILDATAGQGNNHLDGGPGVDTLYGGTNDKLLGGLDNDIIFLGQGNNTATGGRGNDFFVAIDGEIPDAPNVITDFNPDSEVIGFGTGPTQLSDLEITAGADSTEINFDGQLIVTILDVTDPLDNDNFLFGFTEFPILPEEPDDPDEVRLDTPTLSIAEGNSGDSPGTIFSFALSRSGSTLDELTLEFAVTGDGATPANGADFVGSTLPNGLITFAAGDTTQTVEIEVFGDLDFETDEDFLLTISNPSDANIILVDDDGSEVTELESQGSILDDDTPDIALTPPLIEQSEGTGGNTSFIYTITRTGNGLQPLTVDFDVFASGANPADADDFVNGIITTQTETVAATLSDGTAVELLNTIPTGFNGNRSSGTGLIGLPGGATQQFNVAYVIDVSGSTSSTFEGDVQIGDINNDGVENTLLDGEILGYLNLNQSINESGLASTVNVGLIPFDDSVITAGSGDNNEVFVAFADQDDDGNGTPDVEDALVGLTAAGATNFEQALLAAEEFFNDSDTGNNLVFFVSDGEANDGDFTNVSARLRDPDGPNASITAIGLGLNSSLEQLDLLDDGLENDSAQQVTNPDDLTSELLDPPITANDIERIEVLVDGILVSIVPQSELVTSPLGVSYDLPLNDLTVGEDDEVTIRVISSDGSESLIAETVQTLGANENPLVSGDVTFAAGEFTKEITIEVIGDSDFEADENFSVVISNPSLSETRFVDEVGNNIDDLSREGLIINDDQVPLPPIVEDASFVIAESRSNGSVLGTVQASDPDSSEPVFFTILSGNIDLDGDGVNAFSIDAQSGALSVLDSDDLDADQIGQVQLTVRGIDVDGQTGTGIADIQILADQDGDGSPDVIERIAGDRNLDGQPDFIQPDVTSVPAANAPANFDSRNFLTFDTSAGRFTDVQVLPESAETATLPDETIFDTSEGFNSFVLRDLDPEENATNVNLILPAGSTTNSYFVLNEQNQAYEGFVYNGEDGARVYDLGLSGDSSRQLLLRYVDGGRADRDGQVNGEIQQSGVSATSNEVLDLQANNGILSIGGSPGQIATIDFEVQGRSDSPTTYGVFQVDDAQGTIGGLAPGDDGYLAAALSKAQVIAETIPGQSTLSGRATRTIQVGAGQQLGFFSIADNLSFADIIAAEAAGGPLVPGVIDSDLNDLNISVPGANPNGGGVGVSTNGDNLSLDFGSVDLVAEINDDPLGLNQFIGNLQSDENGELFDLRDLAGQRFNANFTVNRDAVNTNTVGFYEILDESGAVRDSLTGQVINPGDNGYVAAAIANRVEGLALRIDDNGTRTQSAVIEGGSLLAPYVVVEGGATDINNNFGIFFAFGAANPGNFDQIKLLGDNIFGFEDVTFGGDQDYNDIIVRTNFSVIA